MRSFREALEHINALEESLIRLKDDELREKTALFKEKIQNGCSLEDVLNEAFAVVREASRRVLGIRHFDVQILGGLVLYHGGIAEMATGEGKTLAVTTAAYLRSLKGLGMHIVTVNDYLARRDADWMGGVFNYLGTSVGCIVSDTEDSERSKAYNCDITYATNNELGFDYLRDNTKYSLEAKVQRRLYAACVDEVDSILIDEARTPLVLSGPADGKVHLWRPIDQIIKSLSDKEYILDEKLSTVALSEDGVIKVEKSLERANLLKSELYDPENAELVYQVNQSLRANTLFKKDVDYIVREGKILCINKNTGRVSEGRRYAGGLHQAIEAKEKVQIQRETEEIASITFQNYFRMYESLSGMTGTAMTEAEEFKKIYGLEVFNIPSHKPVCRKDFDDEIYATVQDKHDAICKLVQQRYEAGQPVLLGTGDIEQSELLSSMLTKLSIPHCVLNAKNHQAEAFIIAQAGCFKRVTISTNMAGRGTDIMLGGNPKMLLQSYLSTNSNISSDEITAMEAQIKNECQLDREKVIEAGGLFVLGALRHESRRIDNQLKGRSGRQGDVGCSKFFVSLEDPLIKLFASEEKVAFLKKHLGIGDGKSAQHPLINMVISTAQKRIENQYYEARQHLLKFDEVIGEQRAIIYKQRDEILAEVSKETKASLLQLAQEILQPLSERIFSDETDDKEKVKLVKKICFLTNQDCPDVTSSKHLLEDALKNVEQKYSSKEEEYGIEVMHQAVKYIKVVSLDQAWREHLHELAIIKEAIQNRAYAQKDPLNEYKAEAFASFEQMLSNFTRLFIQRACRVEISTQSNELRAVRRNQSCPCGSGKKYKHCHGVRA